MPVALGHQDTRPTILLDRKRWAQLDLPAQEALLFHELGHCLLDRRHDNRIVATGEWHSLMRGGAGRSEASRGEPLPVEHGPFCEPGANTRPQESPLNLR